MPKEKIYFPYRVLWGLQVGKAYQKTPIFFNPGVINQLWQQKPDVIICGGWQHYTYWLALAYARMTRTRFLIWSESTLKDERISSPIKDKLKRWMINKATGYIVPGKAQKDYLINFGGSNEIWIAPNAVDSDFFTLETEHYRQHQETWKEKLHFKGCIILFVGRLIDEKGIPELLEAFAQLSKQTTVTLAIVGDGVEAERYQEYCQHQKLENIIFAGFKSQSDLVKYYAVADIFVFPTRSDPWGLVLNEAMAAGLPIVCSAAAGAADDLIENGGNGFIVPVGDVTQLAEALQRLVDDEDLRKKMGMRSREIILNYTPQTMAQGLKEAILSYRDTALNL